MSDLIACFSALQRAEIAEIWIERCVLYRTEDVSVLFNEPKLLKSQPRALRLSAVRQVSVLFNEPKLLKSGLFRNRDLVGVQLFQCSSTSRNC